MAIPSFFKKKLEIGPSIRFSLFALALITKEKTKSM